MITKEGDSAMSAMDVAKMRQTYLDMGMKGGLLAIGAGVALKTLINKIQNDTRRKAIIEDLMLNDPIIKKAPKEQVLSFYATINNVAPSIAVDKNAVTELLQHFIKFGTIDLKSIKDLAETHGAITKNKNLDFQRFLG